MNHNHGDCFLCRYSLPEWFTAISTNARLVSFKKGQSIFTEGDVVTGFYFLHTGKVKIHKQWGEDKDLIIKFAGAGDVLGHRGMGTNQFYPVSATALENITACFVTPEFLKTTLKVNNELTYQLMLYYANELQEAEKGIRNMVHMDVKSRIADSLLKIASLFGINDQGEINSTLTRQDIASFVGTTYETLFKLMNEMIHEGVIESSGKNIRILDKKKLNSFIKNG
ncbi:transcriptional regulator /transcriptional regulator, Crp/Fnr family [Chitinophaga sp. CF118]|uniref:Crp/Fnr family transcriptional regulator n=1 Tax=Chitinophaga sp. CF118 TaxID=1884367 RepID=UPI0008F44B51|nr:Crp/Fnr family transcriptional regulator [Chitinophaga sp. CF118]SFD01893.1 transcriptional regulator /transcriptional regulator, Crp/Fnr family [Chitinophaga sp. CF118]